MKNDSIGSTSRSDPDCPRTVVSDWDGAVIKKAGQVIGTVKTRGKNKHPIKEQVAVRYSPDVLAFFRASGRGWQTRMNDALKEWVKARSLDYR